MVISKKRLAASWLAKQNQDIRKKFSTAISLTPEMKKPEFCLLDGEKLNQGKGNWSYDFDYLLVETHKPRFYDFLIYACDLSEIAKKRGVLQKNVIIPWNLIEK